jgi:putative oxidoreductase
MRERSRKGIPVASRDAPDLDCARHAPQLTPRAFDVADLPESLEVPVSDSGLVSRWRSWAPYFQSLLRVFAAFLFMQHGMSKLFGFPVSLMPGGGTVALASQLGVAGILETFGGACMLLGLFTRPVAFVLTGEMAVAYFTSHAPNGFWPLVNHGEPAVFFAFAWLFFSAAGPGPWSIDALRHHEAALNP